MKNFNQTLFLFSLIAVIAMMLTACEDKHCGFGDGDTDYFIFGHFYGECAGEGCVEMYKLQDGRLYEDDLDHYPNFTTTIDAHWNQLSNAKYEAVKDIENDFPDSLYLVSGHVLGMPDAGDWGGVYVETKYSGDLASKSGFWLLDKNEYNMTQVYNDFVDSIEVKIALIQ